VACPRVNFRGIERLEREDQHLLPSSIEAKNENYNSTFPYTCMAYTGTNVLYLLYSMSCYYVR